MMNKVGSIVFQKELKNIFRDKKALVSTLILPLFLTISTLFLINYVSLSNQDANVHYVIGTNSVDNTLIGVLNNANKFKIQKMEHKNINEALKSDKIEAYIIFPPTYDRDFNSLNTVAHVEVLYNSASINSLKSYSAISAICDTLNINIVKAQFNKYNISETYLSKLSLNGTDIYNHSSNSDLSVGILIPMILLAYTCMGTGATATEITAGEKEHGTLEPLLSSGADRKGIVLGKFLATTLIGTFSGLFAALGILLYCVYSGSKVITISSAFITLLIVISIVTAMSFAATQIVFGICSRSYKEAQTYSSLLSFLVVIPCILTYSLNVADIPLYYFCIPLLNSVCLIKEGILGFYNFQHLFITLLSLFAYVVLAFTLSLWMFKKEKVIFRA